MTEKQVENYLKKRIDGLCFKWVSPGNDGVPDRIVIFKGAVYFVELKNRTGRLSAVQIWRQKQFAKAGVKIWVLWDYEQVNEFIDEITRLSAARG